MRPRPIRSRKVIQRFPFADNAHFKVKSDDVPCRKNKVVSYDELYALKGVPFHEPEALKHFVERKRRIDKLDKEEDKRCRIWNDRRENLLIGKRKRIGREHEENDEKKNIYIYIMLGNRNKFKNCFFFFSD